MGEITLKIEIPEEILKQVDLNGVVKRLEREILCEYNVKKLRENLGGVNLEGLLEEVETSGGFEGF
ncbi:MAG: hypothetical protein QXR19_08635 [Candidatus Jordarchaeaceae archaeon]